MPVSTDSNPFNHNVPTVQVLNIMHSHIFQLLQKSMRPNHVNYVCHEMYAFTNKNSWFMKFLKIVKKMKKCVVMKEIYFQTVI